MKNVIFYLSFCTAVFIISSCTKPNPENRIPGTWKLVDVTEQSTTGTTPLPIIYASGYFTFNTNGTSSYQDIISYSGTWTIGPEYRYSYDAEGNYAEREINSFHVNITNQPAGFYIDWKFDEEDFSNDGNQLYCTIYGDVFKKVYTFQRH